MLKGLFILGEAPYQKIYGPAELADLHQLVDFQAPPQTAESIRANLHLLENVEVIFSGWGGPLLDEVFLNAAPNLKAVFYGAGSIRGIMTDAFWQRGIVITSAAAANAVPVAEFTLAQIILSLKQAWRAATFTRTQGHYPTHAELNIPGLYGSTVGLISLGMIGQMVAEHLQHFKVNIIAYDPFIRPEVADALHIELCGLDEIFQRSDVVSLHSPWLPETVGMITGDHFRQMKPYASFINTARGAIIREAEMIAVLQDRPDLTALLDVTYPEPPAPGSALYTLPNVVLTPHIAGSMDMECRRMGRYMVDELQRYLHDEPLRYAITLEQFAHMA
jgi:phosphoglycerate dehydrogenase-like enzyme